VRSEERYACQFGKLGDELTLEARVEHSDRRFLLLPVMPKPPLTVAARSLLTASQV
jgi:hypothetical protein